MKDVFKLVVILLLLGTCIILGQAVFSLIKENVQIKEKVVTEETVIQKIENLEVKVNDLQKSLQELNTQVQRLCYLEHVKAKTLQFWTGKTKLEYNRFYATVWKILTDAPIKFVDKEGLAALIVETAATESFFGNRVVQKKGPALGVFQMEPATSKCLQENFLTYNKKLEKFTTRYIDKKSSKEDNLKYNIPYQIALCLTHYVRYGVHKKQLSDKLVRAQIYKKVWNTVKGSGSVTKFYADTEKYLSKYYANL